jgi:hypothetical protein
LSKANDLRRHLAQEEWKACEANKGDWKAFVFHPKWLCNCGRHARTHGCTQPSQASKASQASQSSQAPLASQASQASRGCASQGGSLVWTAPQERASIDSCTSTDDTLTDSSDSNSSVDLFPLDQNWNM